MYDTIDATGMAGNSMTIGNKKHVYFVSAVGIPNCVNDGKTSPVTPIAKAAAAKHKNGLKW